MALKGNMQVENLEAVEDPQVDLGAQVSAAPRAKRQARQAEDVQGEDPYLESINELDDVLLKFKKYSKSMSSIENKVFSSSSGCFKSKNERVDAYSFACSSYTDKIEEYLYDPANSFPYKRGVKLVPKENSIYVEVGADTDMYGICVDVCEFSCTAYVLPITNNFEGYLVTRNPSIKIGEILDKSAFFRVFSGDCVHATIFFIFSKREFLEFLLLFFINFLLYTVTFLDFNFSLFDFIFLDNSSLILEK
ncbi:DUF228 domain-containing protein [Borreliella burgdorferi]|uniref:DUF228 domain-containing protein n=1 Tax=Borreliella burgdorferi TaxID=139 RepID=UPI002EDB6FFF